MQSLLSASFVSAPKASRDYFKILMTVYVNHKDFAMSMCDGCRAFAQSDYLHESDRLGANLPDVIRLGESKWDGSIYLNAGRKEYEADSGKRMTISEKEENTHALILYRPLYGTRDAPLRW